MEAAAIFRLVLAFGMAPLVWGVGRRLQFTRAVIPFTLAYILTIVAYGADVLETYVAKDLMNIVQHGAYVLVALSIFIAALFARIDVIEATGIER